MDLLGQLSFESDDSRETQMIRQMKATLVAHPEPRGDKLTANFKMARADHGQLMAAVARHDMTVTDVLMVLIKEIVPVLQRAKPVEVAGWKEDKRTKAAMALRGIREKVQDEARKTRPGPFGGRPR